MMLLRFLFLGYLLATSAGALEKPNIILIYADDISARELPMYGSSVWSKPERGDTSDPAHRAKTPVLDQLAREGCAVKTAWASVICSPSRAMMMTGRYAHIHKWWNNNDVGTYVNPDGKRAKWPLFESSPKLISHIAREGGYGTYWAGKTQMPADLTKYGFDEGCFTPGKLTDKDNPYTDFKLVQKKVDGKMLVFNLDTGRQENTYLQHGWYWFPHVRLMNHDGKPGFQWWPNDEESKEGFGLGSYGPDIELDFIFGYMERQKKQGKPFFIYHTTHLGHDAFDWFHPDSESKWPGTPVIEWDGQGYKRKDPDITGDKGLYETHGTVTGPGIHSHVNYLDYQVWLYRNKLKEMGIEKNTVLIFCADNGTSGYGKNNSDRQKGTHVPLVIYAPGMKRHGMQDTLVDMSDLLPTIAELAGVTVPEDYEINGKSLVPFLFDKKKTHRDWIYSYSMGQQIIRGTRVMKDGFDKWWDVSSTPDDLISFTQIKDWKTVSAEHRVERDKLKKILPAFDLHATAHDAPGNALAKKKKLEPAVSYAPSANPATATAARSQAVAPPTKGERIVFIGNGLAERDVHYSRMETELHLRYPEHQLWVRNMGRSGDTPGFRPHPARKSQWAFPGAEKFHPEFAQHHGKGFFPTPDQWLTHLKADTVVAFFGYNESFGGPGGVASYEAELDAFVQHTLSKAYNGKKAPRLVLVSPIAFEDLSAGRDLPDGKQENANLALYTAAMERVAKKHSLTFTDLFTPTKALYAKAERAFTINGFAPTEAAYHELGKLLATGLYGDQAPRSKASPEMVHAAVKEKDWFWNNDYNLVNGVHTHGQRYNPFGPQNYPDEVRKTREMTALRDTLIHEVTAGKKKRLVVDDSATHELPPVPTNFVLNDARGKNGVLDYKDAESATSSFTTAEGYQVELFASESDFPDLKNPVQMSFDNRGRLWVAVMPSYPHYLPGGAMPDDKLIILEDTDGDGRADKQTTFADGLHLPIGFEISPKGVYLSQQPNLCLLVDDDKDDRADRMEILLHGFDSHDTHHAISAYCADASGAFYLCEGRFLHSQVETPYGPRRCNDGGIWRFDPKSFRLERYSQTDYSNPWGISFDYWEQCHISDASPGENWWGIPVSAKVPYGLEIPKVEQFVPKRSRPTSGAEFVSSRHFPDGRQGDFMACNSIGFLGISFATKHDNGSGYMGKASGDLLTSSDANFRPVDLEFAPDGSLYLLDWHNPLIGHMQHNMRDPNRDHDHGRIYRITYPDRPLVEPAPIAGASIPQLLENLKLPEYRTRYRTRRELRGHPSSEVIPAVKTWAAQLDKTDPEYEHHLCEALWATWAQNQPDPDLLAQCLNARQPEARAAAAGVLRFAHNKIPNGTQLLTQAARDTHGRVRLEAIVAASWLDNADGARIALEALKFPLDRWMGPVTDIILRHTLNDDIATLQKANSLDLTDNPNAAGYLDGTFKITTAELVKNYGPTRKLNGAERKIYKLGKTIYGRDAHCATCHQANGKGIANIYPPLSKSAWIDDDERLIKITLKGLWGPIEVNGVKYDPSKGVPPMTGFAGMLNDNEIAAVLSYVRQSFGNDGEFITPGQVRRVREATRDRVNFYMADEILEEHPLKR